MILLSVVPGPAAAGDLSEILMRCPRTGWSLAICLKKTPPVILTHNKVGGTLSRELGRDLNVRQGFSFLIYKKE